MRVHLVHLCTVFAFDSMRIIIVIILEIGPVVYIIIVVVAVKLSAVINGW